MKIPTVVFVGTYPPRECGIATFTQDLLNSSKKFLGPEVACKVAALNVSPLDEYVYPPEVKWKIDQNNKNQHIELAKNINDDPLITGVIVQHEYGIYGGKQGKNILYFMENCRKPILMTLHTVLPEPTKEMKIVTEKLVRRADAIVVLTQNSKKILETVYPMSKSKVRVIPHGIHLTDFSTTDDSRKKLQLGNRFVLSTFGLLSRGKGIEYVIKALPAIVKKNPNVLYLILGKTHPAVRRSEGESYRNELTKLILKLGLKKQVKFYDQYLNLKDLIEFLKATDIYISTSINPNQAVSGTLSYALGTGRAVVSTEFAQSREIITNEIGRLVPIKDSGAMSRALIGLLSDKEKLKEMHKKAFEVTRPMLWSNVASLYSKLLSQSILWPPIKLKHLKKMTDGFGLFQFAKLAEPNIDFGYTIDDNARALIVASQLKENKLVKIYLNFIKKCQTKNGDFINYINFENKLPSEQNQREDLSEANGRVLWALNEVINNPNTTKEIRVEAKNIWLRAINSVKDNEHLRANALVIKAMITNEITKKKADNLVAEFRKYSNKKEWQWFEPKLSYNNAVLSESLFLAGRALNNNLYFEVAKKSLDFLIKETFRDDYYLPIGNTQWYRDGETKSEYDQQPEDSSSMVLALMTAYKITKEETYFNLAKKCFSWFLGNNSLNKPLYNHETNGCYDGLTSSGVNLNQGAESLVSYLLARVAISKAYINEN